MANLPSLGESLPENEANIEESRAEGWREEDFWITAFEPPDLTMPKSQQPL